MILTREWDLSLLAGYGYGVLPFVLRPYLLIFGHNLWFSIFLTFHFVFISVSNGDCTREIPVFF